MENNLPILVLDLWKPGDLMRAVLGEQWGPWWTTRAKASWLLPEQAM
jgi:hypothetical protein